MPFWIDIPEKEIHKFQASGVPFNRGILSNIGFKEAMLDIGYDCIVIHDLDILPEDKETQVFLGLRVRVMMFNANFNNISVISWWSVLLVEETGVSGENQ
jgi:hypothetical protein